ncbi:Hypothetical predicted protein [Mytilus galloprovincialis]|uniref:Uncharacterized protein n=1 Tax=Mytilus galloprovincialis TaxID=29158 RepID=A0A8B6EY06_MYTGA|nr:Hypothetical predicted protein [Mytilus galloprovincialis]
MDFKLLISLLSLGFAYAGNLNKRNNRCDVWTKLHNKASKPSCPQGKSFYAVWTTHNDTYIESCFDSQMVPQGNMLIMDQQSGNLNSVKCPEETIQPQAFLSYTECGCNEFKSRCNEKGQAIYSNGSTFEDRSCRCDYIGGYTFVNISAGKCSCNPKVEMCACRRQNCEHGYKLSQDYTCIEEKKFWENTFNCPSFSERIHQTNTPISPIESNETGQVLVWKVILTVFIPTAAISGFIFFVIGVAVENKNNVCKQLHVLFNSQINNSKEYEIHPKGLSVSTQTELAPQEYTEDKDVNLKKENITSNNALSRVSNQGNGYNECGRKTGSVISTSSNIEGTTDGNISSRQFEEQIVSISRGTVLTERVVKKVDPEKQNTYSRNALRPRDFQSDSLMESYEPLLKDVHGVNKLG